jgi:hypothetical protein
MISELLNINLPDIIISGNKFIQINVSIVSETQVLWNFQNEEKFLLSITYYGNYKSKAYQCFGGFLRNLHSPTENPIFLDKVLEKYLLRLQIGERLCLNNIVGLNLNERMQKVIKIISDSLEQKEVLGFFTGEKVDNYYLFDINKMVDRL